MIATGTFNFKYEDFGIDISRAKTYTGTNGKSSVSVTCPKCSHNRKRENQKKPCLWINIVDGLWKCHNCEWTGGLEFGEKGNKLFEKHFPAPEQKTQTNLSDSHYEWLVSERCIAPEVIKEAKLYSDGNRVVFPFYREGKLVNFKKRTPSKTGFEMFEGAEKILYGLEFVKKPIKNTLVFVEGETDALAVRTAGYTAVSVPNGSNSNLDCIRDLEDKLPRKIILAGDSDEKGKKLTAELAHRIGKDRCWLLEWPDGIKDSNDFLIQHGAQALTDILEHCAKPYPIAGIYDVESVEDEIWDYYNNGVVGGIKIGWANLDPLYTVKEGFWTIVTGVPSSGKSGLLDHMAIKLAQTHGWKFGMCSPENQPVSLHYVHLIEKVVGKPFFKGPTERMTPSEAIEAMQWIKEHIFMILPDPKEDGSQVLKLDHILSDFKKTMFRHSTKGLIIDPMNELAHDMGSQREDQYISKFITQLRQFARTNEVHIWLAVHPKSMQTEAGQRHPVVRPSDLMGGSVWWAKADNILSVDRDLAPGTPSESDIHVQKIKPRYIGMTGVATLNYDGASGQYSNKEPEHGHV